METRQKAATCSGREKGKVERIGQPVCLIQFQTKEAKTFKKRSRRLDMRKRVPMGWN